MRSYSLLNVETLEDRVTPAILTVTSLADSEVGDGQLTLREAIDAAEQDADINADVTAHRSGDYGADIIRFNLPGSGSHTITLTSTLPELSDPAGLTIDGLSQPGANSNKLLIELNGSDATDIAISVTSSNNVIRGLMVTHFTDNGISLVGLSATGNTIAGNGLANNGNGIRIGNASENTIGGTSDADRNLIQNNLVDGIIIDGANAGNNQVLGNIIKSNGGSGIVISDGFSSLISNGNIITANASNGIQILGSASGNSILGNAIYNNTGLGIDLGGDGVTANDPQDGDGGPNNLQNFPLIIAANGSTINGSINSSANSTFRIELFAGPSANGAGQSYFGAVTVTTDDSGNATFSTVYNSIAGQPWITATATLLDNGSAIETSEFSAAIQESGTGSGGNPATGNSLVVTNTNDSGAGSLRQAIITANSLPTADTITFDASYFATPRTITLTSPLTLTDQAATTIVGLPWLTISGDGKTRILQVDPGAVATLNSLILTRAATAYSAGAVNNRGSLTLINSVISYNFANGDGGGVYNSGSLTLKNSTFLGNVTLGNGGGIYNSGVLTIDTSTIANNSANQGAGVLNLGTLNVSNSTIAYNTATSIGGGILAVLPSVILTNSIIADNSAVAATTANLSGSINANSSSYNLIGAGSSGGLINGINGNKVNVLAMLGQLGYYEGPTPTIALLPGSPALDSGTGTTADQRGINPVSRRDIGAFESRGFTVIIISGDPQSTTVGQPFSAALSIKVIANAAVEPVAGGIIYNYIAANSAGAAAILSAASTIIDANGNATVLATANSIAGSYGIYIGPGGTNPAYFRLTNTPTTASRIKSA